MSGVLIEQREDFPAQFIIATAGFGEECRSGGRLALTSLLVQLDDLFPAPGVHNDERDYNRIANRSRIDGEIGYRSGGTG
jgi:hypothetical protein